MGRQYRVNINNAHYKVDLVFYHRILRCFVLIDLKIDDVQHHDIGQMNLYLGYFANEENIDGDNPPIGIILSRHKDERLVEYATYNRRVVRVSAPKFPASFLHRPQARTRSQKQLRDVLMGVLVRFVSDACRDKTHWPLSASPADTGNGDNV